MREATDEKPMRVLLAGTGDELGVDGPADKFLRVGDGVRFGLPATPRMIDWIRSMWSGVTPTRTLSSCMASSAAIPKGLLSSKTHSSRLP